MKHLLNDRGFYSVGEPISEIINNVVTPLDGTEVIDIIKVTQGNTIYHKVISKVGDKKVITEIYNASLYSYD